MILIVALCAHSYSDLRSTLLSTLDAEAFIQNPALESLWVAYRAEHLGLPFQRTSRYADHLARRQHLHSQPPAPKDVSY
jgi:hypothetical protein